MAVDLEAAVGRLRQSWVEFCEYVKRPRQCIHCEDDRIWWNGTRWRSASSRVDGKTVMIPAFPCRRVVCAACRRSWTLLPSGLLPGRHFDLTLAAEALSIYLFEEESTRESVAKAFDIAPRTLGRFVEHLARVASAGFLQTLVLDVTGAPILARLEPVRGLVKKARSLPRRLLLEEAGKVLCVLEALGRALGLPSPGLASVLSRVVGGRRGLTSYRAPSIPADAWCVGWGVAGSMPM